MSKMSQKRREKTHRHQANCAFYAFLLGLTDSGLGDTAPLDQIAKEGPDQQFLDFIAIAEQALSIAPSDQNRWERVVGEITRMRKREKEKLQLQLGQGLRELTFKLARSGKYKEKHKARYEEVLASAFREYACKRAGIKTQASHIDLFNDHPLVQIEFANLFETHLAAPLSHFDVRAYNALPIKAPSDTQDPAFAKQEQQLDAMFAPVNTELQQWWQGPGYEAFTTEILDSHCEATELELSLLSEYFGVQLEINCKNNSHQIPTGAPADAPKLTLYYQDRHYDNMTTAPLEKELEPQRLFSTNEQWNVFVTENSGKNIPKSKWEEFVAAIVEQEEIPEAMPEKKGTIHYSLPSGMTVDTKKEVEVTLLEQTLLDEQLAKQLQEQLTQEFDTIASDAEIARQLQIEADEEYARSLCRNSF